MEHLSIAIDGPSGAGKSSVASALAARLNILHLDTGAMYRAFAWQAFSEGLDTLDGEAMEALAKRIHIQAQFVDGRQQTLVNGNDVTDEIRTPEISMGASNCSKFQGVRSLMVQSQQQLSQTCAMVLDGRDIGTKVLPHASLKVFLTASPEERARRRFAELAQKGEAVSYEEVLEDVRRRDEQDSTRAIDPLRPAKDALVIDSSQMTQEQVVDAIAQALSQKGEDAKLANKGDKPKRKKQAERFTFLYFLAKWVSCFLFNTLFPIRYHNVEKAQLDAPFILICNHNSMIDPLVAGWQCRRYQLRFLGKKELTQNPLLRAMFNGLLMIPVDRHNMDMHAIRACLKTLKEGHALAVFPEGTRHRQGVMEELESGIALIALMSKAPLLPVYLSSKPKLFRRIDCYYGDPIPVAELAEGGAGKANCDRLLATIREAYVPMVATHQQAVETLRK